MKRNHSEVAEIWNPIRELFKLKPLPDIFDKQTILDECVKCRQYSGKGTCPDHRNSK